MPAICGGQVYTAAMEMARSSKISGRRKAIPDDVKIFVWRRDQGHCVHCGSTRNLEFGYVATQPMGGADTSTDIGVVCEACNRAIDPRGIRVIQAGGAAVLLLAFVADWGFMVPTVAVMLFLGAGLRPRWTPLERLYAEVIRPRLDPPNELEGHHRPCFTSGLAAMFLAASTVALLTGAAILGWALVMIVTLVVGLAAVTGTCVGCGVYTWSARRRGVPLVS